MARFLRHTDTCARKSIIPVLRQAAKATGGTGSALGGPAGGNVTRQCHDMAQKKAADCDVVPADFDRQDPAAVRTPQMWPPVDRSSSPSPAHLGKRRQASSDVMARHAAALMLQRSGRPAATAASSAVAAVDSSPHRTGPRKFLLWRTVQWRPPPLLTGLRGPLCRGMTAHVLPSTKGRGLGKSCP